jgi:predicted ATPase
MSRRRAVSILMERYVPTAARRISYADALAFERQHEAAYREHGFELVAVPAAPVAERAALIAGEIAARS